MSALSFQDFPSQKHSVETRLASKATGLPLPVVATPPGSGSVGSVVAPLAARRDFGELPALAAAGLAVGFPVEGWRHAQLGRRPWGFHVEWQAAQHHEQVELKQHGATLVELERTNSVW